MLLSVESFGFLKESQTFIGVMISILVLCILMENKDDNNILKRLIDYSASKKVQEIQKLLEKYSKKVNISKEIEKDKDKRKASKDKLCLERIILNLNKPDLTEDENKISEDATDLNSEVAIERLEVTIFSEADKQKVDNTTQEVKGNPLPGLASFFCVLYGIFLFVCDEILLLTENKFHDFIISIIVILTTAGCLYWLISWFKYILKHNINSKREIEKGNCKCLTKIKEFIQRLIIRLCSDYHIKRIILSFAILSIISLFLAYGIAINISNSLVSCIVFYAIGIGIPVMALLYTHHILKFEYAASHGTITNHFSYILIYALIITSILFIVDGISNINVLLPITNTSERILRTGCDIFILGNGLLLAYLFPYMCIKRIHTTLKKKVGKTRKNAQKSHRDLNKRIHNFIERIPSDYLS